MCVVMLPKRWNGSMSQAKAYLSLLPFEMRKVNPNFGMQPRDVVHCALESAASESQIHWLTVVAPLKDPP